MRTAVLLWAAALAAQAKDIRFDGNSDRNNYLHPEAFAKYSVFGHRVDLTGGVVTFVVVDSGAPPVEIVTPSVTVQPFLVGRYRVEVTRFGETHVTPTAEVRIAAPQGAEWVLPGQKMIARGAASAPEFRIVGAVSRWRRFADRLANAFRMGGISAGGSGGLDDTPAESARHEDRGKAPEASKPEARTHSDNHPNQGPISSAHPSRVSK